MTTDPVVDVVGLVKSYRSHLVLSDVTFEVAPGHIFALLGPNGAGKTTTLNILSTLVPADGGTVRIGGVDVRRDPHLARRLISLTGQSAAVDEFQTGRENLRMMATLAHLSRREIRSRTETLLGQFDLTDAAARTVSTYSGGMRRRLDLAISLVSTPAVVFLDEPTTGLDPRSRVQLWEVVRSLAREGTTILLTTQYLEEADQLADRVAVLDGGSVIASGTAEDLKRQVSGGRVDIAFDNADDAREALTLGITGAGPDGDGLVVSIPTDNPVDTIGDALARVAAHGLSVADISIVKPSLDDVFLALTGRPSVTPQQLEATEVAA
ncbi:MAG: ATP-binding cassette domain-containing protein [Propionibacteriaceae bacterium]